MNPYRYILAILVGSLCMYYLEADLSKTTIQLTAISSAALVSGCIAGIIAPNYHWLVGIITGITNVLTTFFDIISSQQFEQISQISSPSLTIFICTFLSCILVGLKKRHYKKLEPDTPTIENTSMWIIFGFLGLSLVVWVHYFLFPYTEECYRNYPLKRYIEPLLGVVFTLCTIQALFLKIKGKNS
jgi:hypothetical protein